MRWFRILVVIFALTVMAAGGGAVWLYRVLWGSSSPRPVALEIEAGTNARQILEDLHQHDLLPRLFILFERTVW